MTGIIRELAKDVFALANKHWRYKKSRRSPRVSGDGIPRSDLVQLSGRITEMLPSYMVRGNGGVMFCLPNELTQHQSSFLTTPFLRIGSCLFASSLPLRSSPYRIPLDLYEILTLDGLLLLFSRVRVVLLAGVSMVEDDTADSGAIRGLRLRVLLDATSAERLPFAPSQPDPFADRAI